MTEKYWFINKAMTYSDVSDIDNIKPLFISFVDRGANGFTFEVMEKEVYINKNFKADDNMVEEKQLEEKFSLSTLEKLRDFFSINKSEDATVEAEPVQAEPVTTEPAETNHEDLLEEIKTATRDGIVEGLKEIKKAEEKVKEEAEAVEEKAELEDEDAEPEEKEEETVEAEPTVEDVKINKRETVKEDEIIKSTEHTTNFYKMSGRDSFGCKIRK